MKKLIAVPCFIFILISLSFSQLKNTQDSVYSSSYWNISFSLGPTFNFTDRLYSEYKFSPGCNAGFELFYTLEDKKSAIVFSYSFSKEQAKSLDNTNFHKTGSAVKKELLFGPRFYIGKGYFVEALIGNFLSGYYFKADEKKNHMSWFGDYKYVSAGIGGAIGTGKTFGLSKNIDAFVKAKISFGLPELKTILNTSLNAGVIFNNRKIEKETDKDFENRNFWIISVTGGVINPEFFQNTNYDLAAKFGIEAALRKSSRVEVFCSLDYNDLKEKYNSSTDRNIIDLTFGPRFLFGSSKYLAFAEMSTGFYIYDVGNDPSDGLYMGANFGPGIIINFNKYMAFTAKSSIHIVFNPNKQPGGFLTASGGIRYEL